MNVVTVIVVTVIVVMVIVVIVIVVMLIDVVLFVIYECQRCLEHEHYWWLRNTTTKTVNLLVLVRCDITMNFVVCERGCLLTCWLLLVR